MFREQQRLADVGDRGNFPAYSVATAAHYLKLPTATLRSWVSSRTYSTVTKSKSFKPLIAIADPVLGYLSFINLVEIHVLAAIRRTHNVRLDKVRSALDFLAGHFPADHPLASHNFETDGLDLFVEKYGKLYNVSREGQQAVRELLHSHLQRVEYDRTGNPIKLFPFVARGIYVDERPVEISPLISFGRPVLANTGIPTEVIADRFVAGESIDRVSQ